MRKIFGKKVNVIDDSSIKNPFEMMQKLSDEGYKKVILVVGGDRVKELERSISKYVGEDGFQFDHFEVRSAGQRDPDAEGVEGMSASKMRKAAIAGDYDNFELGVGNKTVAKQLWKKLRKEMNIKESIEKDCDKLIQLEEGTDKSPCLIVITKSTSSDEKSDTVARLEEACSKRNIPFYPVHTNHAFIVDKDLDDIIGVVFRSKIMELNSEGESSVEMGDLISKLSTVDPEDSVATLLDEFLKKKEHVFLVVDEYGTTQGIITLEDAVETLLGAEIVDESDSVEDMRQLARELWEERRKRKTNLKFD